MLKMGAGFCSLYCEIQYIEVRYIEVWVYVKIKFSLDLLMVKEKC